MSNEKKFDWTCYRELHEKAKTVFTVTDTDINEGILDLHNRVEALEDAARKPSCTCDDVGDGPCPVHAREDALQDRAIRAEEDLKLLRARVDEFVAWERPKNGYIGFDEMHTKLRELGLIKKRG